MIYEPLLMFNLAKGGKIINWLATGYKWSNGNKTLTFTLRSGVKWNDGQPFTSTDVAYTLQLDKLWGAKGYVLPKHVWSRVSNPVTSTDPNPVGTGAFKLTSFSPQVYTLSKNKLYWQKGKPYVSALRYPSYTSNANSQLDLVNGTIDWAGIFIPNANDAYVKPHPATNHYWFPAVSQPVALFLNLTEAPFNNVRVRRAISLALDRTQYRNVAEYGYQLPGHAAFIQPQFAKVWGDSTAMNAT